MNINNTGIHVLNIVYNTNYEIMRVVFLCKLPDPTVAVWLNADKSKANSTIPPCYSFN